MCGICGVFNFDGKPVNRDLLVRMNDEMTHRGPDGSGVFVSNNIGMAHRRLAIIDLGTGRQPMSTVDEVLTVVFNGEIYNYRELRATLEKAGSLFITNSDTEVILHGYRHWGINFVEYLRGMFAIALWDEGDKKLLLARDRLGKKPLYYFLDDKRIVFASEIKSLLVDRSIGITIDPNAVDAFCSFGYVPSPLSIYKEIKKLRPGHLVVATPGGFDAQQYWDIQYDRGEQSIDFQEAMDELQEVFDESVRLRMISDVPLGAFLSGGVDSSAVVASMAIQSPFPVKTSSIGFNEKAYDEARFAEIVAQKYKTEHQKFQVKPDALDVLSRIVWHFDEPFADASAIPTWYVSKLARTNVKVVLSGDGGDEVFGGYANRYLMNLFEHKVRRIIPGVIRSKIVNPLAQIYPSIDKLPRPFRLKKFLTNVSLNQDDAYFLDMSFYFTPECKMWLYNPDFKSNISESNAASIFKQALVGKNIRDVLTKITYQDIMTYLVDDILVKVDRMSMAHSLEVRSPILDHKLIEFAARLPPDMKIKGNECKYIFKKMNESRLPNDILYRKKQGFCVPVGAWIKDELRDTAYEALFSERSNLKEFFDMKYVAKLWDQHVHNKYNNSVKLWGLIMFGLWRRAIP